MSGSATVATLPLLSVETPTFTTPILSRSCRYVQNWVCFLAWTPYSSQTTAYVLSADADGMEGFCFMARATARSTIILLMSRDLSLPSDTELYIMALAALTCSMVTSPSESSSAMLAALSSSSMATLASPYSAACSAMRSSASSVILPGCSASSALAPTISLSSPRE